MKQGWRLTAAAPPLKTTATLKTLTTLLALNTPAGSS